MNTARRFLVVFLILTGLTQSCSRKKNSFSRRSFHETTSHYNYYFNARELLRKHIEGLNLGSNDDYNYILPIFIYGSEDDAKSAYDSMEEILKKCSKLIDRHSMYIKNEEYNKWVDESYVLMGKAKFFRHEYYGAIEIFEYVTFAFSDEPTFFESKIWIARTYLRLEDYREAEDVLSSLNENTIPVELRSDFYSLLAELQLMEDNMEHAAELLKQSIDYTRGIELKRRYTYILAQIYHELRDYPNATKYYGRVLRMRPDYKMAFNAKLNQAKSYDVSADNSAEIKKRLNRMLRDKKNFEFRDQIYFAMAEMAFREENHELGMEYLRKCASSSMGNNKVKSEAYMLLADIYYDKPDYLTSHAYYDSCLNAIPEAHPKKEFVSERKESLDDLVSNVVVIMHQDSLQKVAAMDEKERDKIISKIIKEIEREEELKSQDLAQSFAQSYELANKREDEISAGAKWYFYNQSMKSFGVSEFKKRWGDRTYEDNWRRSNKNRILEFTETAEEVAAGDTAIAGISDKDAEFYTRQLPLTDSLMENSHGMIINALYNAGNIYREQFSDYLNAIACFERLVNDYDTCRYVESAYYQLYRIYLIMGENQKAEEYKGIILEKFPFSEYARIILNPEYMKNKRDRNEQVEAYYGATYKLYSYEMYSDVIEACQKADSLFGNNHMKPKFDYLKALAAGKSLPREEFRMALKEVIAQHPTDDVAKAAQSILDKMDAIVVEKEKREAIYKLNFRDEHIFVVMVPNNSVVVEKIKNSIADYNSSAIGEGKLKVSAVIFDPQTQMISVKSFKNKEEGLAYVDNFSNHPSFREDISGPKHDYFIISTSNYAFFYQEKNLGEYLAFYGDHYLK